MDTSKKGIYMNCKFADLAAKLQMNLNSSCNLRWKNTFKNRSLVFYVATIEPNESGHGRRMKRKNERERMQKSSKIEIVFG